MISVYIIFSIIVIAFCITLWVKLKEYQKLDGDTELLSRK